jgi:hypothetical protein
MVSEMIGEFWNASGDSETTLLSSPASIFASHSRSSRKNGERDVQVLAVVRRPTLPWRQHSSCWPDHDGLETLSQLIESADCAWSRGFRSTRRPDARALDEPICADSSAKILSVGELQNLISIGNDLVCHSPSGAPSRLVQGTDRGRGWHLQPFSLRTPSRFIFETKVVGFIFNKAAAPSAPYIFQRLRSSALDTIARSRTTSSSRESSSSS